MKRQTGDRIRKVLIRDNTGHEYPMETEDSYTLAQLEDIYRSDAGYGSDGLMFADARSRDLLDNKREKIGDLWPGLGDIELIAIPDTINAGIRSFSTRKKNQKGAGVSIPRTPNDQGDSPWTPIKR